MSKSARTRNFVVFLSASGAILLAVFIVFAFSSGTGALQPIAFNHKAHLDDAGLHCTDCHLHAADLASAGIPSLEVCQNCHSTEPISKSPEELKVLKYVAERKEVPWVRIYKVPDHVYFSHRRHVTAARLECSACHGNVNELTEPPSTSFLPVTMENCVNCHKERKVSNDCLACHR